MHALTFIILIFSHFLILFCVVDLVLYYRKTEAGKMPSSAETKPGEKSEVSPKKPYRALMMRAINDYGVKKEKKKRAKKSSNQKRKRSAK